MNTTTYHNCDLIPEVKAQSPTELLEENLRLKAAHKSESHRLLVDLVEALNRVTWSSWQSTYRFNNQLKDAEEFIESVRV